MQKQSTYFLRSKIMRVPSLMLAVVGLAVCTFGQTLDRIERERAKNILNAVRNEIKGNYYDPKFGGVDLEAKFKAAGEKLDMATSLGQSFGIIAQAVLELNDSHTTFYPPSRASKIEYGWRMQMFGDSCFVTAVQPGSDAEKQGLKIGDQVLSVESFKPTRKDLWKMNYYYNAISPRQGLNVKVLSPGAAEPRTLNVASKVTRMKTVLNLEDLIREFEIDSGERIEHRFVKIGSTSVWKMPTFAIPPESIDEIMSSRISGAQNLILDLRNNGGGYVVTLERLAGYFVDKETKIADLKGRKEMKPQMAKPKGKGGFAGRVVVLVDSKSGSASEILARFLQLNGRGVVIGDQSAGAVMQSRGVAMELGVDSVIPYGMNLTNADVIMTDGVSLEHIGVTPQLKMVPTAADLAAKRDPVMAAALQLLGHELSAEQAGQMFPFKWDADN